MSKSIIYADNAATTGLDPAAFETMKPYLLDEFGNPSQSYSFSVKTKQALKEARKKIAMCINALPEEIFFTSGGTESDNWAIKGMCSGNSGIITSKIEHHAVLRSCEQMEKMGFTVKYLSTSDNGTILPETLLKSINSSTKLVSIMLANNEIGTIQPIKELVEIAHRHSAYFHTDAVQAVGHISVDVKELGVDLLSASAHKFNGPRGIGFLYIKQGTQIDPFMNGGSQELGLRAGTENVAAIVGMATALENNCNQLNDNSQYITRLTDIFFLNLEVPYHRNGNADNSLPGLISLSFEHVTGEALLHILDLKGIAVSTGSACDNVNQQLSHVIRAIGTPPELANGTIRISFGKNNTEKDAVDVAAAINFIIKKTLTNH